MRTQITGKLEVRLNYARLFIWPDSCLFANEIEYRVFSGGGCFNFRAVFSRVHDIVWQVV